MRRIIVRDGAVNVFFMTSRRGVGRVVAGYYHMAWQADGSRGADQGDFALAADRIRFVDPLPPSKFPKSVQEILQSRFRTQKPISANTAQSLLKVIDEVEDRTASYIDEIVRLEQFARDHTGLAYPSWGRTSGFTWDDAQEYLQVPEAPESAPNSSPSGKWRCTSCRYIIENRALLKKCPVCGRLSTLRPE